MSVWGPKRAQNAKIRQFLFLNGGNCILKVTLFFLFWPPAWGTCLFSNRYAKMAVNGAQMNLIRVSLAQN